MRVLSALLILFAALQYNFAQKVDVYSRPVQTERSRDFDAIHYRVSLKVNLDKKILSGENQITLSPLRDNFDKCIFDAEYIVVENVINSGGKNLPFEQKDNQVFIDLTRQYNHADTMILTVKYTLNKPTLGLRFIDATATNPLMVSTDCFPNKARQWIPCYDYPNDKVTTEMVMITK